MTIYGNAIPVVATGVVQTINIYQETTGGPLLGKGNEGAVTAGS
jgi:hypothetical protein